MHGTDGVQRRRRGTAFALALAMIVSMFVGVVGTTMTAQAANRSLNAITDVDIILPDDDVLNQFQRFRIDVDWEVPVGAEATDFFEISWDQVLFAGYSVTRPMVANIAGVGPVTLGQCTITSGSARCVLNEQIENYPQASGSLFFTAQVLRSGGDLEFEFLTNAGVRFNVPVPPVGEGPGVGPPNNPRKQGFVAIGDSGDIVWRLFFDGDDIQPVAGQPVEIIDTFQSDLRFVPGSLRVESMPQEDWGSNNWVPVPAAGWTIDPPGGPSGDETTFTMTFTNPNPDRIYRVQYRTEMPADRQPLEVFENSLLVGSRTPIQEIVRNPDSGVNTNATLRGVRIRKAPVEGPLADRVPPDTEFRVNYVVSTPTQPDRTGFFSLLAGGQERTLRGLTAASRVRLTEVQLPDIPGVDWGEPRFTGDRLTRNPDGSVDFAPLVDGGMVNLTLTNTIETQQVPGEFSVTKEVTGSGAPFVQDQEFTVDYSVDGTPATEPLLITPGESDGAADLPIGSVITLSEVTPTAPGVTFGTPEFSGAGVTDNGDGTASFTISGETGVDITLTNPAQVIPGAFLITKETEGSGADQVKNLTFEVDYTVDGEPATEPLTFKAGESDGVADLPIGSEIVVTEVTPDKTGVTFGTPEFSGAGVTDNGDGTASFTISDETVVDITLTNPVTEIPGGFAVTKELSGDAASLVEGDEYTVTYTVDGEEAEEALVLVPGEPEGADGLPIGSKVKLTEVLPTSDSDVTFGTPEFSGKGVKDHGDGTASFTIGNDTIVDITLTNPVTTPPPTAKTGADTGPLLTIGGLLTLLGLSLVMLRRRRVGGQ